MFQLARDMLLSLSYKDVHPKNWLPQVIRTGMMNLTGLVRTLLDVLVDLLSLYHFPVGTFSEAKMFVHVRKRSIHFRRD